MAIVIPWVTVQSLPGLNVNVGQTRTTAAVAVPIGLTLIAVELDGSGWAPLTAINATIDFSDDGGVNWLRAGGISPTKEELLAGKCIVGFVLAAPNANTLARVRASITVNSGSAITLAGTVQAA